MVLFVNKLYFAAGKMPMKKVKWTSKLEHEYIANFKLLQDCFNKTGVDKVCVVCMYRNEMLYCLS